MWNDDDRKWLYEQMRKNGVNTGSYDDFTKSLDNKEDRDWYYQKSRSLGLNVGSADDFASMMVQPVQKPAPAQPVVKQTTGQVNPTVNTSTQPKQDEQPQKQGGWQPTWQEKMGMQMQLDETMRQVKQSQQDFNTRMENIRKGNTLGKTSEVKFNPESGKMERRYYTTHGDEVTTPLEQSRLNLKYRDEWEATTPEGRKHREKRIENDFERRVGASLDKYDPDNAAAMVWQQAEDKSNEEFGRYLDERSKPSWSNFLRGAAEGTSVTGGLGADNVDTGIKAFATHLKYHDLQRMADDAWNMLGKEKQQSIIEDMYGALKNRYPQATEQQLQQAATEMAREQSDRRMYELAVAKNAPKDAAEYFIRKVAAGNAMGTLMQAAARAQAGTTGDWEAREDAEQRFEKQGHKVAGIAGTVTGFALDPLTWASAGAGGAAVKGTTWLGGKMIGEAAMRKFGTTLGGRMLGGAIGGAVNFGTYEAGSEALDQMKWGGYIDEETGERKDGFSFGNVAGRAGHGLMMGAVTGVIAPYLGNVSDKLVRATESTVGKMGIRAGELGVGTVAEGTIFAVPEIIDTYGQYGDLINSLSDETSPNYIADEQERAAKIEELRNSRGDALMDVWTDNMAMIAGFKAQHLLKSAPRVIYDLARSKNGKAGFETRLRSILDGRGDLALTEDEKKELERRGYGDLKDLTEEYSRYAEAKEEYDKARPTTTDASRMIEGGDGQAELPYNRFVELMTDNSVSEAARAKMYYYLTGHGLPMSTVMGSSILEDKDADGNVTGYTVQSFGANGVITSRSFGDKKRADVEVNRINRQAELNGFDVGERYYDWQGDNKRMYEACETVAEETGAPANLLFDLMKRKTEAMNEVELEWAEKILNAYNGLGDKYGSSEVRTAINEEFGVDVDKAIRKERNRRSEQEQKAVDEYASRLFADLKRKQEEAAERGEAPVDPDAPTSNSQIAALLGIDDGEQGDPVSAAFNRGHEADAQERQDIAIELTDPNNSEAQEAWNGVVQRINEDAAYMVAQQREQTKQMQHTDGSLRPAILKEKDSEGNDQQVYIVDGNVQMMPDGSVVDKASSDNIVVIYNPATGERKQIDPSADTGISSLGEVTTAEQREADIERSRQEYVQAQIDEAQGTVRFVPGQQLVLPTGEEAVVVATDADGENITVALGDGTQATVQRSELQRIRDEKASADYRQRHGITEEPAAQQHEASAPAQPQTDGRVAGAPADYTADMELTIRDEDGSEKPAMVMGRVRYENGSFVPDANGNIIEYFMDGEVKHDHEDKLIDKVVSHVAPQQPEAAPVQEASAETPATVETTPPPARQQAEVAPQPVQEPVQTVEPQPAQPAEAPAQPTEQPTAEPMPVGEDGEEDWQANTPERAHAYIFNEAGLSRSEGNEFIAAQTQAAKSALVKAKSAQMPRVGTSIKKYNEAKAKRQEKIDEAQRVLDYWQQVRNIQNDIQREENERRAAEDAVRHDEAVAEAQADYEARKQAEAERKAVGNENPMPAITEKWNNATKVDGHRDEIMLPDGTPLKGHYVLHESGASSPSHNPETWQKTDGFPMDANDNSVNDRDYERDHDAQEHTQSIARQYDQRALQSVPVVSNDGVVLSGNGRTMAGELAARDNTDGAYVNYLKEYAPKFGFTPEQVEAMQHPRVSFVPDEAMPYTAETFAKFNQQEMKSQNKTEQAVKLGKTVNDDSFKGIVRTINGYDTLGDFYNDAEASLGAVYDLHNAGVVPQAQLAEMVDGVRGQEKLSAVGREFLENMLIGKAFEGDPEVVRMLTAEPAMRQTVITALGEIVDNIALGGDWSLHGELADAVKLCFDARQGGAKYGEIVSTYARQGVLFADPDELQTVADFNNATMLMLADVLNDKRVTLLKTTLQLYNNNARQSAVGQADLFAGGIQSREDILRDVITFINENYGKRKEIEAARAEAVERRKAESVQQDGTPPAVSTDGEATAEPSAEPAPVEAEPVEATEPVEAEPNAVQTALAAAEQETNTEPTEAQKEAGNYKKGHVKIDGYDVTIENPKGSVRRGTDASGKQWEQEMQNTYGYIRGTEGVDGDHIDVFFSEDPSQGDVFVVDQVNKDGSFDEHKVMYGFPDIESARKAYLSNYEDGWQGLGAITPVSKEEFKKWIDSSHRKTKPFAEYSSVKPLGDTQLGEQPTAGYSIEPTTYTNKKGKTTPMHLVTFGRELSKDEIRAGKELAKESRGWWDREKGGFMMRDEDSAKALAEALSNEEAVQDAQPLSVEDVATVTDQADMKAVDETIKVEQEPQTTPQYDYDREGDIYDKTLTGLRNVLNDRKRGAIPNIKSIENVIRDLRKRAKTIEDGMATAAGETIPQAFDALANLNGRRKAYEQFLVDIRKKMAETERDMMRSAVQQMGEKLHTDINIIEDVNEITHPNAAVQERRRKSKGWYDTATGQVNIVLDNNKNIDDVKASVGHETIAHKGLRELVGEENYDEFLDETYQHLRDDLKKGVDDAAGRAFIDDTTKNGKRAKSYEQHRRTAVDELFGRMAEKPFEEFSEGERTLWQKIKATVRRLLDKFLGSLKLPKWFELGDNELRYILWRSKERLERGKEHPIDLARDIVKREELGLTDEARYNMGDVAEPSFASRRDRAVKEHGYVHPGLNSAEVKVVSIKEKSPFDTSKKTKALKEDVVAYANEHGIIGTMTEEETKGKGKVTISKASIEKMVDDSATGKSLDKDTHISITPQLREVIAESLMAETHPDYNKGRDGKRSPENGYNPDNLIHRCYGAISIDGQEYRVKLTLKENPSQTSRKAYTYEVTKIELLDSTDGERTGLSSSYQSNSNGSHTSKVNALVPVAIAKVIKNVEKSYDTGKKLLDESKLADESTDLYRDPEETEDIWNDQSLGLQERITAAATRLANNHRDNKTLRHDAMRAIGGNLSDLRKAMSLQRTFDMTTVKRVADLARVLMNNGYLNGLTQQEVKRLLAAVKNSVGHNDIEGDVQKVMDIMVDNQLKHAEDTLHELEAIRGSKVDARGVEVQGQLDPDGAHVMKVFKKTRGWEKTDIEEAMSEAQQRMGSSDVAVADEAALEYTGLQLALEYAENIKDSKVEERKLREEIKQAHDDASERDRATDSYRQYIASLQEAIRQNKIERAQSYFDLVGRLSDSLRESIANAKDFKEAEKQRIREIQHNANSDMEGRPSDEHYKPTFADKFVNNSFVSFLFAPLATFDQMLRMFGSKSANGEGYLYNRFMRGWIDARQQEINGVRDKYAILDAKAAELFGGKVKTWGDLIRRVGKLPKGTVSFWNGGEMQERELTQGNLMYIYMVNKMLDGRMKLRKMGITDENVADIEEVLDPRLIELADWLQDEFLVQTRNEYNETHKRMFGASMAAIEHYFPLKILANARADKPEDLDNPDKSDGISTATGSIIKRRRNALALDITGADALSVILDHVAQMEHWNAFAEFNRDINTLRTYKRFRNQVQNMTTIYGSGKELWKKFNDVCQMAAGTYRPPRTKLDETAVNFAKGVTAAKVSFRMFTALKQFLSMPAYIPEARTDYLLRNIANPVGAWKWSMEHLPIFSERWRSRMSGDPRLLKSDMDWKMWRTRIMQLASRAGMSPNAFVDALTVSIGAHSMYQTRLAQYLRDGYSEADAEKKAVQDAEVLYNQTQQSSEGAFTSTMQVDRSWLSVLFTVFRNASMSYQRQLHDAFRNFKHNLTPGGRARSIEFMKKQYVRDGIDEAQAEQNAKRKFRRQLLKDTLRVATFGYIMQFAWNLGAYLPYLLFGDDDETKDEFWDDIWTHTMGGWLEGLTGGDVMSLGIGMWLSGEVDEWKLKKEMPLTSDLLLVWQKLDYGQHAEALNDMINLIVQSGLGVNPQSITDVALSIMDACGDDPALAHEATICISRILQVPQSQIDKMYFDEVGLSGDEVSKYTPAQLAERYAQFNVKRGRFFSPWSWGDEKRIKKFTDKANKTIKERTEQMGDKHVNEAYLQYEEVYKGVDAKVKEAKKTAKTDYVEAAQLMADAQSDPNAFATYQMFKQMDGNFNKIVKFYLGAKTPDEAALCRQAVLDYKSAMVKVLEAPDASTRADAMNSLGTVMQGFTQKYIPMQQPNR